MTGFSVPKHHEQWFSAMERTLKQEKPWGGDCQGGEEQKPERKWKGRWDARRNGTVVGEKVN